MLPYQSNYVLKPFSEARYITSRAFDYLYPITFVVDNPHWGNSWSEAYGVSLRISWYQEHTLRERSRQY